MKTEARSVLKLIGSFWLLFARCLFLEARPAAFSPACSVSGFYSEDTVAQSCDYDGQNEQSFNYDAFDKRTFDYGVPLMRFVDDERQRYANHASSPNFAIGVAAKNGPVVIGETMARVEQAAAKIPGSKNS